MKKSGLFSYTIKKLVLKCRLRNRKCKLRIPITFRSYRYFYPSIQCMYQLWLTYLFCNVCQCAVSPESAAYKWRWIFESVSCVELRRDDFVTKAMNFEVFVFRVMFLLCDFPSEIVATTLVYYPIWLIHCGKTK